MGMELSRVEIYVFNDKNSPNRDPVRDMDLKLLSGMPVYSVKGNSKQRIGSIRNAYPGNRGIYADIILGGGFTLTVKEELGEDATIPTGVILPDMAMWKHP